MANSVDPDETARDEPSHLDLHCLNRYLFWSVGLKGLKRTGHANVYFLGCPQAGLVLRGLGTPGGVVPFEREKTFMTSCLLSGTPNSF